MWLAVQVVRACAVVPGSVWARQSAAWQFRLRLVLRVPLPGLRPCQAGQPRHLRLRSRRNANAAVAGRCLVAAGRLHAARATEWAQHRLLCLLLLLLLVMCVHTGGEERGAEGLIVQASPGPPLGRAPLARICGITVAGRCSR